MTTYQDRDVDQVRSGPVTPVPFTYELQEIGSVLNIRMRGELDLSVVDECRLGLEEPLREQGRVVVLDVGGITFADSTGLGMLMHTKRKVDANGGRLLVARMSRPMVRLLEASGMTSFFEYLDGELNEAICPVCERAMPRDAAECPSCGAA